MLVNAKTKQEAIMEGMEEIIFKGIPITQNYPCLIMKQSKNIGRF